MGKEEIATIQHKDTLLISILYTMRERNKMLSLRSSILGLGLLNVTLVQIANNFSHDIYM